MTHHAQRLCAYIIHPLMAICLIIGLAYTPAAYASEDTSNLSNTAIQQQMAGTIDSITNGAGIASIKANSYTYGFISSFTSTLVTYAQQAYEQFSGPMATILTYTFAIWFCYKSLSLFLGLDSTQTIVWDMAKKCAVFMLLYSIILGQHSITYWNMFINYPLNITTSIGQSVISSAGGTNLPNCSVTGGTESISNLPDQMGCISALIERGPHIGMILGMMMIAGPASTGSILNFHFLDLAQLLFNVFSGMFIFVLYFMNMVAFTFMIMDLVVKICIISSLAPIFVGCYFLPITRGYAMNALSQIIGGYIQIVACCFTMAISSSLLASIASSVAAKITASGTSLTLSSSDAIDGWKQIIDASTVSGSIASSPKISAALSIYSSDYWAIFAVGIFMVAFAKKVQGMLSILNGKHFSGLSDIFMPIIGKTVTTGAELGVVGLMKGGRKGSVYVRNTSAYRAAKRTANNTFYQGREKMRAGMGDIREQASEQANKISFIRKTREFMDGGRPPAPHNPLTPQPGDGGPPPPTNPGSSGGYYNGLDPRNQRGGGTTPTVTGPSPSPQPPTAPNGGSTPNNTSGGYYNPLDPRNRPNNNGDT